MNQKEIKKSLKNKTILLASWGCKIQTSQESRDWPPVFKNFFKKVILFSFKNEQYYHGSKVLNKNFIELIKKEKPDYLLIAPSYDELYLQTLKKLKKINPKMKTIIQFGDDEFRFDDWSRYYSLFFDYILTTKKEINIYKKENIKAIFMIGVNPKYHKPINIEKIYDVTFIGAPLKDRYDYIKYLRDKGVNIKLFGGGWEKHQDLADIWGGFLYPEEFIKVINQSKINLNFSKTFFKQGNNGQMKGRVIEVLACNSFLLTEFTKKTIDYLEKNSQYNFKTKEELLKKINFYLKNEKEREKLAEEGYKHILKYYTWKKLFQNFFYKIEKDKTTPLNLPKINKKTLILELKDLNLPLEKIKEKIKNADYIQLRNNPHKFHKDKEYFQSYSLSISNKEVSLCDYYVYNSKIGNYLSLLTKKAFNTLNKNDFSKVLNLNQIMVTKKFFLENIYSFKNKQQLTNLLTNENTVFVSIPLAEIYNLIYLDYKTMNSLFRSIFFYQFFSLAYQKRILNPFFYKLLLSRIKGKLFIFKYIYKKITTKENWVWLDFFH